jgi:hypothetical protein
VCFRLHQLNVYIHHTKETSITNACIPLHLISTAIWGLGCQDVIHGAHTTKNFLVWVIVNGLSSWSLSLSLL